MSGLNSATSPSFQNRSDLDSQNLPEMKKKFRKPSLSFNQRKTSRPDSGNREQKSTPSLLFSAWSLSEAIGKDPEQFEKCRPNCWEYKKDLIAPLKAYDEIERQMANDSILGFRPTPGVLRFWNEMKKAKSHIYLYDNYVGNKEFCRILRVLMKRDQIPDAPTIRLLLITSQSKQVDKATLEAMLNSDEVSITKTHISILIIPRPLKTEKNSSMVDVHDRFALIDKEIWHFGAAIGAMHRSLNAFSGPWEDKDDEMKGFFHKLVEKFRNCGIIGYELTPED